MRLAAIFVVLSLAQFGSLAGATFEEASSAFNKRIEAYVKLRKEASENVPPADKKATPAQIQQRELALAEAIRKARPNAQPGEILTADVKPMFNALLKDAFKGPGSSKVRASVKEGNPKNEKAPGEVEPVIKVNAIYPKNAPLSTVPPSLLMKLPKLPKEIEYRFVGRTLILRDTESNLIIDYMKEAVPAS
jgi:hypothetical protein